MDTATLVEHLKRHFGTGSNPQVRLALYQRLAQLVSNDETRRAERILATVIADAAGKSDPGRYFAHVAVMRLEERGFSLRPQLALDQVFGDAAEFA